MPNSKTKLPRRSMTIDRNVIAEHGVIPNGMKFIQDTNPWSVLDTKSVLTEDAYGKQQRVLRVTGLFQEFDKLNANRRVYSENVLRAACSAIQPDIEQRGVIGELDHPETAKVHLDRISHVITKVWIEGKKVFGEAEILDNQPLGACLRGLFERKIRTGISSRGVGDMDIVESANSEPYYRVCEGYTIITWDAVHEPSVFGANLNVMEGLNKTKKALNESVKKGQVTKKQAEHHLLEEIHKIFGTTPLNKKERPAGRKVIG